MARWPSLCDKSCASLGLDGVAIKWSESENHFLNKNRLCLFSKDFALAPLTPVPTTRGFRKDTSALPLFEI